MKTDNNVLLNKLTDIRESILKCLEKNVVELDNTEKEHDGVYMFFSFDIVNSTSFKEKHQDKWRNVISKFYDISEKTMNSIINKEIDEGSNDCSVEIWKYVGDEILFYKKISSRNELFSNVIHTYSAQERINKELCNIEEIKDFIYIKTSVWIAKCSQKENDSKNKVYTSSQNNEDNEKYGAKMFQMDFLGPDIDAGFRISKYSEKKKLVISAKLACLLYKAMEIVNEDGLDEVFDSKEKMMIKSCMKIVSYEQLKGVWDNRYYPIIWYSHSWDKPIDMFDYDDYFTSHVAKNLFVHTNEFEKFIYDLSILPKIYNDLNRENDIDIILNYLEKIENRTIKRDNCISTTTRKNYFNSQLHCAAICFNNENEIFIAKRSENRENYKNAWDFGCGKMNSNETWQECLTNEYKKNFGLELKFNNNPIVVAAYNMKKQNIKIPGVIFFANVEKKALTNNNKLKYSEVMWLKLENIQEFFEDKETVDDMVDNIKRAIKLKKILDK